MVVLNESNQGSPYLVWDVWAGVMGHGWPTDGAPAIAPPPEPNPED